MTRAEAIEVFREWIDEGFPFDGGYAVEELADDEKEACNMAISALEQEPCEDAISREAVLKLMFNWNFFSNAHKMGAKDDIKKLPSVQPSRKGQRN